MEINIKQFEILKVCDTSSSIPILNDHKPA